MVSNFKVDNVDLDNIYIRYTELGFLKPGRKLWTWGDNSYGQLGLGDRVARSTPTQVGLSEWSVIAVGDVNTFAIKSDSTLWSWGNNSLGQLGTNDRTHRSSPVQIIGSDWSNVLSYSHSVAVKTDGTLWTWGHNNAGQLGSGDRTHRSVPVQVGSLTDWSTAIAVGESYTLAVKSNGTLWAWGGNSEWVMAILAMGMLGTNDTLSRSSPVQIGSLTNWSKVAAGHHTSYAIKSDGTLWAWGYNVYGELGLDGSNVHVSSPTQIGSLTDWRSVTSRATYNGAVAIKTDGTLWKWGTGGSASSPTQVGSLTNWALINGTDQCLAIKANGTLWDVGLSNSSPIQVGSLTTWVNVATRSHYAAITND